jgi:DNA-binding beta-propeller fold protein YncE
LCENLQIPYFTFLWSNGTVTKKTSPAAAATAGEPSTRKRIAYFLIFGLIVAAIVGITVILIYNDIVGRLNMPRGAAKAVAANVTIAPFVSFDSPRTFPMGLAAAPNGTWYLSLMGAASIRSISADGTQNRFFAQATAPGAIALAPDGHLYVIDYSAADSRALGKLKRYALDGGSVFWGEALNLRGLPLLATLAIDSAGNVYVSHPDTGEVWRVDPNGIATAWWSVPPLRETRAIPVGLAYDAATNSLIVTDAGTGTVYRVMLDAEAPKGDVLYRQFGADIRAAALDDAGRVLLAIWKNENGQLARLEPDGQLTLLAEGFRAPTSLHYAAGKIYVVNSDAPGLISQIASNPPYTVDVVTLG